MVKDIAAPIFFDKEYILISHRYLLHPAYPNGITDAHNQKTEEELQKSKVPLQ
jgi:hypothetical protein